MTAPFGRDGTMIKYEPEEPLGPKLAGAGGATQGLPIFSQPVACPLAYRCLMMEPPSPSYGDLHARAEAAEAENERLRKALRNIESEPRMSRYDAEQVLADVQDIAAEAIRAPNPRR